MTILNHPSDGLHPELIVLARTVAFEKAIDEDALLKICAGPGNNARITGAFARWSRLGLFNREEKQTRLNDPFSLRRGQSLDEWTDELPNACRNLALNPKNSLPLWGPIDNQGPSADFAKGVAWLLAQDIFQVPRTWSGIQPLEDAQITGEKIIQNDTRLNGLRFWARYCGFATGDSRSFFMDPTAAIRAELVHLKSPTGLFDVKNFLAQLSELLPVLDTGDYRNQVEERLDRAAWRAPPAKHLSPSLSFALRRLELEKTLLLDNKADAEDAYWLSGANYRTISRFTHVRIVSTRR